ncbi:MAG: fumarate hydratase [Eubacteriales bacterium]|nr:fumarate hydratase [Bacillota bacterium]MDZ4042149.1 fumarate hydratase [Eubacteriales bacterium]MDZ7609823.1 fumarate hydratase [Eubacteriales bacterium]
MRTIEYNEVVEATARLCEDVNFELEPDVEAAIKNAVEREASPTGRDILGLLLENAAIAARDRVPICQDTGIMVVFVECGEDVRIAGGGLTAAITEGVRVGYDRGYLRKSVVGDPIIRKNTGDNTPPVIYFEPVAGDTIKISVMPKGAGSENMSALRMLKPAEGLQGIKNFVLETVEKAGPNACPPLSVGVGIGGTMEKAALLSKQALLRELGQRHPEPAIAALEEELTVLLNRTGIGPGGLGGRITTLGVHIEVFPTHIAMLPVAVNLNCHAVRHKTVIL